MIWFMVVILALLSGFLFYKNYQKKNQIAKLEYELQRTMKLVNKATSEGFKL